MFLIQRLAWVVGPMVKTRIPYLSKVESGTDQRRGFSLFEILIVLALLSLVASISLPTFNRWVANSSPDQAVDDFTTTVLRVSSKCIQSGSGAWLVLTWNSGSYVVNHIVDGQLKIGIRRSLPRNCRFDRPSAQLSPQDQAETLSIFFDGCGRPDDVAVIICAEENRAFVNVRTVVGCASSLHQNLAGM